MLPAQYGGCGGLLAGMSFPAEHGSAQPSGLIPPTASNTSADAGSASAQTLMQHASLMGNALAGNAAMSAQQFGLPALEASPGSVNQVAEVPAGTGPAQMGSGQPGHFGASAVWPQATSVQQPSDKAWMLGDQQRNDETPTQVQFNSVQGPAPGGTTPSSEVGVWPSTLGFGAAISSESGKGATRSAPY